MNLTNTIAIILLATLLQGCTSGDEDAEQGGAIPAGQLQALEKAKGTQQLMQEAEEKRRKEMEEQGI